MSRVFGRVFLAAIFLLTTGQLIWAASGNKTMKLKDVAAGQVVQVGNVKFVKVAADKYLALDLCPQGSTYSSFYKGCVVETTTFDYTGDYQTFTAPVTGTYVVELWGGGGGYYASARRGSLGGYVAGNVTLNQNTAYYLYLGPGSAANCANCKVFQNGTSSHGGMNGGGASDLRTINGDWDNNNSLRSRIIVAAAAGMGDNYAGPAGGLIGYNGGDAGEEYSGYGGTQTGVQGKEYYRVSSFGVANGGCTGGNGWWPAIGTACALGSGGGSSYISGHTGCVAVTSITDTTPKAGCTTGTSDRNCSLSPTGYSFTNTVMIDGAGYSWTNTKGELTPMPDPTSVGTYYANGVGHTGNGAARITQLSVYLGI